MDPSDGSVLEVEYRSGVPWGETKTFQKQAFNNHNAGTYRHLRGDGQLLGYGRCKGDERHGPCLRVRPQSHGVMNFVE